jgi:hypothetical protein
MTSASTLQVVAAVHEREAPGVQRMAERLAQSLARATERNWSVPVAFLQAGVEPVPQEGPALFLASLRPALDQPDEDLAAIEASWCMILTSRPVQDMCASFLCTVFRCEDAERIERIRRLNLLAAQISHDTGTNVIDIDRAFAHVGARALFPEDTLKLAADTMMDTILAVGLDELVDTPALEQMRAFRTHERAQNSVSDIVVPSDVLAYQTQRRGGLRQTFSRMSSQLEARSMADMLHDLRAGRIETRDAVRNFVKRVNRRLARFMPPKM